MTSNFGDYYDHISDFIKSTAILTTLYFINPLKFFKIIPILTILLFLMIRHIGCQEKYYNTDESNTLDFTKKLCPVDKDKNIVSGDSEKIKTVYDTWVFSKDIKSSNPNWLLINTIT